MSQQNDRAANHQSDSSDRRGMGVPAPSSENDGIEREGGANQENSSEGTSIRTDAPDEGKDAAGKVLKRLEVLESEFLEYVHAHQERLKTRLSESEKKELSFLNNIRLLKSEVYELMSEDGE